MYTRYRRPPRRRYVKKPRRGYRAQIGNVQGGWAETVKYKDKQGNWRTRRTWGSGKAGW